MIEASWAEILFKQAASDLQSQLNDEGLQDLIYKALRDPVQWDQLRDVLLEKNEIKDPIFGEVNPNYALIRLNCDIWYWILDHYTKEKIDFEGWDLLKRGDWVAKEGHLNQYCFARVVSVKRYGSPHQWTAKIELDNGQSIETNSVVRILK